MAENGLLQKLNTLTKHHHQRCKVYRDYIDSVFGLQEVEDIADVPYLPARAFKNHELRSVGEDEIVKVLMSSGTTGQPSKIFLDKETSLLQIRELSNIFKNSFGNSRFPMLVVDAPSTITDRKKFSARTAAINGFSMFAKSRTFALDDDYSINFQRVSDFLSANEGNRVFVFGFTFLVWKFLVERLLQCSTTIDLSNSFIVHGGGWKKLEAEKVTNAEFKATIEKTLKCLDVRNYYGMVEQTGTISMECNHGRLHAPDNGGFLVRDLEKFDNTLTDKVGLIQVFSAIQKSYPGHSILTEDLGILSRGSDCPCGNENHAITVIGRLEKAEVRGCSDT